MASSHSLGGNFSWKHLQVDWQKYGNAEYHDICACTLRWDSRATQYFLQMIIQHVFQGSSESDFVPLLLWTGQGALRTVDKFYFNTVRQNILA